MADLIDPDKLRSVAQIAKELGYSPNYFSVLATTKKFKAWHIGNTWASTREIVEEYIKNAPPAGRPKLGAALTRHNRSTRKSQNKS